MLINPAQFSEPLYHGTSKDKIKNDTVQPATKARVKSHWGVTGDHAGQPAKENAFATTNEDIAWRFADHAAERSKGRSRVYKVDPAPDMKMGNYHEDSGTPQADEELSEYVSKKGFPVKDSIDIKPGHQGTFPINWRKYADPKADLGDRVNHPNSTDVEYGHFNWSKPDAMIKPNSLDPRKVVSKDSATHMDNEYKSRAKEYTDVPGQMNLNLGKQFEPATPEKDSAPVKMRRIPNA